METIILTAYFFFWNLLTFAAFAFFFFALDDLLIDTIFFFRGIWRWLKYRNHQKLTYEKLSNPKQKKIAIMVACWQEAGVIDVMLKHNTLSIDYDNYALFIGLYPNDKATCDDVCQVAINNPKVIPVIGDKPGPSNKADNLNRIYHAIKKHEKENGELFDIYVFHDSEDIIHPLSLKLYNYLMDKCEMIQIPVFPLAISLFNFTHWIYADEFAENHTKNMIVREAINGFVPSAGVGTAFSQKLLSFLSLKNNGMPFSTTSLTEDYRTALAIKNYNFRQLFVTQSIKKTIWQKKYLWFGPYVSKKRSESVATRELFPTEYKKSVIQKSRWVMGIALQEWKNSHWQGNLITKFLLFHDRKALAGHLINGIGYIAFAFWLIYSSLTLTSPQYPSLQEKLNQSPYVWWMIIFATMVMFERLIQRMLAVNKIYGFLPALFVFPRSIYGNILNLHSVLRAYRLFFFMVTKKESKRKWDKTEHHFPGEHVLVPYKKRLGDLLIEENLISEKDLAYLVNEQQQSGLQLGQVLIQKEIIDKEKLSQLLAKQYQLDLISSNALSEQSKEYHLLLPNVASRFIQNNHLRIIDFELGKKITLGISDPSNQPLLIEAKKRFKGYQLKFVLVSP